MATARDVVGILFGLSLAGFSIANAGLGMLAPRLIQGASASKLIFTRMFEPHCSIPTIEADIASGDQSYCLEAVGVWDGIDILFLVLGLFVLLYGRIGFTKVGRRSDRRYHVFFAAGAVLFSLAILDRLEFLPVAASSEGLSELSPIAVSPFLIQCIIATVGALMMGGPKYWESEGVEQARNRLEKRRNLADTFRGTFGSVKMSLGSRSGASQRISRSRLLNRDAQLHMRRTTSSSIKVLATCPYCKGGGCTECGNTGTL